ncbi:MAG: hypothetical protein ACI8TQ_002138 [Planctomycetota bacterium]|jgi:hypothetical protein
MRPLLLLLPLLLGSTAFAQTTWTVQGQSMAGDFTDIQSAVDAASTGDTILIRTGAYDGFEIDGKGLNLIADEGASVSVMLPANGALIRVANLSPGTSVTMRGLNIQINAQLFTPTVGLARIIHEHADQTPRTTGTASRNQFEAFCLAVHE